MLNPIFKDNVKGQKHPEMCVVAEPELPCHREPRCIFQNEKNGRNNLYNSRNHHDEIAFYQGIGKKHA